ncbi:unnamed protein product [Litomosoides sigmodontis]|uniref:Doublecortin domain-containing protein n=1 Tax=Litomosoides sigmodontis TaxID=42156 RepID=A0A3P6ST59_LITSI|nr:unnamed protein product [Litomosoides sigmodontis]
MNSSHLDFSIPPNHAVQSVDLNYRGIRIKVHKNGDQYDRGTTVVICRKRFKHWLTFLDFLTKKLNLTAPVHEFYRTDGLRIRHFEEIENGGSYVAVSQGAFIHKPYGLLPEDREKWNINPKFKSPEQSTLDSSESVDIYLKQRGYTSWTGLPFPFDGGVCANHSSMERGRSRAPSVRQHHNEQKLDENSSKNGDLMKKESSSKERLGNFNSQPITHPPTICNTEHHRPTPEPQIKPSICGNEAAIANNQIIEQSAELSHSTVADANVKKVDEDNFHCEIATQNDRRLTVKEYGECMLAPVMQIPDSSRKFPVTQDVKHIGSLEMMQTTNLSYCSLPSPGTSAVSVANDDAVISTSNSSIIIVNIAAQKHNNNVDNVHNNDNKSANDAEIKSLANKLQAADVPSENSAVKMALLPNCTQPKTPVAIHISSAPLAATTDLPLWATARTVSPKRSGNDEENAESSKRYSKESPDNLFRGKNSKTNESNLMDKFKEPRSTTSERDISKNSGKLNEVSKNLKEPILLSSVRRIEFKQNSDDFGGDEDDSTNNNEASYIGVASEDKCGSENQRQMTCVASNARKVQESLATNKNSHCRKHVTLVIPSSTVEMNEGMESRKAEISSDSEGELKYPRPQASSDAKRAAFSVTDTMSAITSSDGITDIARSTADSRDVITHAAIPTLQRKYQSDGKMSFEADYTPRNGGEQRNSTPTTTLEIETDSDRNCCRLPTENNYDPDFKDYDFIQ